MFDWLRGSKESRWAAQERDALIAAHGLAGKRAWDTVVELSTKTGLNLRQASDELDRLMRSGHTPDQAVSWLRLAWLHQHDPSLKREPEPWLSYWKGRGASDAEAQIASLVCRARFAA